MVDAVVQDVMGSVIEQLKQQSRKSSYRTNPALWAQDVLGIQPWSKQEDILNAVMENDHVAVRSCHGSGKSYIASIIAAWWISVHPEGEAIVVTTAPTYHQVHSILWEDIRKHHINAEQRYKDGLAPMKLPGRIKANDEWKSDSGVVLGFGRKPADNNDHGFQGIHRRYVLVIVDESCGIRENLFVAVEAITTTENSRILAIGNPDDPASYFYKFFSSEVWHKIDVSSFDSPNFTREHEGHYEGCDNPECLKREWAKRWDRDRNTPVETLPLLPNHEWVDQREKEWAKDSPLWKSKVLGEFPDQSVNTLFSMDTIYRGHNAEIQPMPSDPVILGVDLSRFGPDYSTIYKYENGNLRLVDFWGGKADEVKVDGMESAAIVNQWAMSLGATEVRIDSVGIGGPILDRINMLSEGTYKVVAMKGNQPSPDPYRWVNARAYWYDELRRRMYIGEIDIDPTDIKLQDELSIIQYHFKNRYKALQIESKEEMAQRGVKSPDFSDAAVYAAADMSYVTENPLGGFAVGQKVSIDLNALLGYNDDFNLIGPY